MFTYFHKSFFKIFETDFRLDGIHFLFSFVEQSDDKLIRIHKTSKYGKLYGELIIRSW